MLFLGCHPLDYLFWDRVSHWRRVRWGIQAGWQAPRWLSLSGSSVLAWRTGSHLSVIISGGSGWTTPQTSPHLRFWRFPPGDDFFCTLQLLFPGLLKKQRDKFPCSLVHGSTQYCRDYSLLTSRRLLDKSEFPGLERWLRGWVKRSSSKRSPCPLVSSAWSSMHVTYTQHGHANK